MDVEEFSVLITFDCDANFGVQLPVVELFTDDGLESFSGKRPEERFLRRQVAGLL